MHLETAPLYPAFFAYSIACLVLCGNLVFLWAYSGMVRGKTKTAINREDSEFFGGALEESDPSAVARVLRAHANAQANIYPFLLLGLVFVLNGGSAAGAEVTFGIFTLARIAHSFAYLVGKQPWRTISFVVGGITLLALMIEILCLLVP